MPNKDDLEYYRKEWTELLAKLSDQMLIDRFNESCDVKNYGIYRLAFMCCLHREIQSRPFNSSILFDMDNNGNVKAFCIKYKVALIKNTLVRLTHIL